jgi:hypothetical protein
MDFLSDTAPFEIQRTAGPQWSSLGGILSRDEMVYGKVEVRETDEDFKP